MLIVELYGGIRRAVMVDGLICREATKRFGVHRKTISKMLQFSVPPAYRRRELRASKKLAPDLGWIDNVLEEDKRVNTRYDRCTHIIISAICIAAIIIF